MTHQSPTPYPIIPQPRTIRPGDGSLTLSPNPVVSFSPGLENEAETLRRFLPGVQIKQSSNGLPGQSDIQLQFNPSRVDLGSEGYRLVISKTGVAIESGTHAGIFYGLQTLFQLMGLPILPGKDNSDFKPASLPPLPCLEIIDQPRFAWRGHMLDSGRHFQPLSAILRTLDLMARFKLNIFHWHLTEDQGWRIEINRYPRLTEIGARRPGTRYGIFGRDHNHTPHTGFYSQADIRKVVDYARNLHITVVPEIEIPGHSSAALAAYPELGCSDRAIDIALGPGVFPDIYCAGKEGTFTFLQNVLEEVITLFPGPFIHIGGDEAPKSRWKRCPACQMRMQKENIKTLAGLQIYFTNRIAGFLVAHGRRPVGWSEIAGPGLDSSAVLQLWIKAKKLAPLAARDGRSVIISEFLQTYLDHTYALTPLSSAYSYDPAADVPGAQNILGIEAPLWTEFVWDQHRQDFQTWPRLAAYAETGWTPASDKSFSAFRLRLNEILPSLAASGVDYAPTTSWEPGWLARRLGFFTIFKPAAPPKA